MSKKPTLQLAILCDEALIENGKHTFRGLFEQIGATDFPAVHKKAMLVTRWGNGQGSDFKQHVIIRNEKTDKPIFNSKNLEEPFTLAETKDTHTIRGTLTNVLFEEACDCVIEIYLNDEKKDVELYFSVAKIKNVAGGRIAQYFRGRGALARR